MGTSRMARVGTAVALAVLVAASACSDDDGAGGSGNAGDEPGEATLAAGDYVVPAPQVAPPPAEGAGVASPQPASPMAEGYVEEELLVSGTATSFDAVDTPDDGEWTVALGDEADYATRVIVRRPPPERFSGTVIVEWFNVSAIEASPDWAYLSEEIGREGHAYVGVSAQAQGVNGGDTLLEVDVDAEAAADAGASTDTSGLRNIDPARYGTLDHPGDEYAFDIYSQVGRAIAEQPDVVLGGLEPDAGDRRGRVAVGRASCRPWPTRCTRSTRSTTGSWSTAAGPTRPRSTASTAATPVTTATRPTALTRARSSPRARCGSAPTSTSRCSSSRPRPT